MPNQEPSKTTGVVFTRTASVAELIEATIASSTISLDAALYRFNQRKLARAVAEAARRKVAVRVVLDLQKFEQDASTQRLVREAAIAYRLSSGREGKKSKMHHKFVILDSSLVLTGSYNWTSESEEENYENLVILRGPNEVQAYRLEFDLLWEGAEEPGKSL